MNFEVLGKIKSLFRDITDFYLNWNFDPELVINDLMNEPSTRRQLDARLIPSSVYKLKPYKISGKDVGTYLYISRIVLLRETKFSQFVDELQATDNEAKERSRVDWCQSLNYILQTLTDQINIFNTKNINACHNITEDENIDWIDISLSLKNFSNNDILPLIDQYNRIISRYVSIEPIDNITKKPKHNVVILPAAKDSLFNNIVVYVIDPSHKENLKRLIYNDLIPSESILCICKQNRIGRIFYEMVKHREEKDNMIHGSKKDLAEWICKYFKRSSSGEAVSLSTSTILNALSGKGIAKD